jgi:preprotein translocase subunit SecG
METLLVVVHVFLSVGVIGLVLMQQGKGADMGAAFGSGASATLFGARGAANFLSRTTGILAGLFFLTSLAMAWVALNKVQARGIMERAAQEAPAVVTPTDLPVVPKIQPVGEAVDPEIPVVAAGAGTPAAIAPTDLPVPEVQPVARAVDLEVPVVPAGETKVQSSAAMPEVAAPSKPE